jgi:hypothetical protein
VGGWFKWLYFVPGDILIIGLLNTGYGRFFGLSPASIAGTASGTISFIVWLFLFFILYESVLGYPEDPDVQEGEESEKE